MKHAWTLDAARNNARWCNAVCFAHGRPGRFLEHMWVNAEPVPRFYPNAITLSGGEAETAEQRQTVRILLKSNLTGRWAVKDSFRSLDIARLGFEVLLEAYWIRKEHPTSTKPASNIAWERASHGGNDLHQGLFSDGNFALFCGRRDGEMVAGGTFYCAESMVGVSNVVAEAEDAVAVWHDLASCAAEAFPRLPLVGYESGAELEAAHKAGFEIGDPLRIWIKSRD